MSNLILESLVYVSMCLVIVIHSAGIIAIISIRKIWRNQHLILMNMSISVITIYFTTTIGFYIISNGPKTQWFDHEKSYSFGYTILINIRHLLYGIFIFMLFLLTFDRLIAAWKPMKYHILFSKKRCIYCIAATWLFWVLVYVFLTIFSSSGTSFMILIIAITICFIFLIVTYTAIFIILRRRAIMLNNNARNNFNKKSLIVPILIIINSGIFYVIPAISMYSDGKDYPVVTFYTILYLVSNWGIFIDAVIYIYFQPAIKKALKQFFKKKQTCRCQSIRSDITWMHHLPNNVTWETSI